MEGQKMMLSNGRAAALIKIFLLAIVMAVTAVLVKHIAISSNVDYVEAQAEAPDPHIDYIYLNGIPTASVTITYPQSVDIEVQATNLGSGDGHGAAVYLSFPELGSSGDVDYVDLVDCSEDLEYGEFQPDVNQIYYDCGTGYVDPAEYLMVKGQETSSLWEPGEANYLEVRMSPPGPGTYQVYIKAAMHDGEGSYDFDPTDGTYVDQQCQPVYRRTIEVMSSPYGVYLPLVLKNSISPIQVRGVRGVRMQASSCSYTGECERRLDCLQEAGVNVVYYAVYHETAYYSSDLMSHRSFDSLACLVPAAHERGMEIYVLLPTAKIGWPEHSEWNARYNYSQVTDDWLDFTVPEARSFVADVSEEIVANYDVDGILLDYIRWMGGWAQDAGLTAEPVSLTVQGIYERVKTVRPGVAFAASPFADIDYARSDCGQDWVGWLDGRYIDYVTPMAYADSTSQLRGWLGEWDATGHFPDRIIPRLSTVWFEPTQPKTVQEVLNWIQICYDEGATGMALWDDRYICQNSDLVEALGAGGW
jgi:hypothetical protein